MVIEISKPKFKHPSYVTNFDPIRFQAHLCEVSTIETESAINTILSELPEISPKKKPEEHKQACIALVCAAFDAWTKGRPLEVSLSHGEYKRMRQYTPSFYRFRVVPDMVHFLADAEYFRLHLGFHDPRTGKGRYTKVYCTDKLISLFPFQYQVSFKEVLQLKDYVSTPTGKGSKKAKTKQLVEYRDTPFTRSKRQFILQWNHFMRQHKVTLGGIQIATDVKSIHSRGSWDLHGRFYGPFQNWPEDDRARILIDGKRTKEPDFSSYHVSMLYDLEGLPQPEGNHYLSILLRLGVPAKHQEIMKAAAKRLMLTLINAKSDQAATQSFTYDLNTTSKSQYCAYSKRIEAIQIRQTLQKLALSPVAMLEAIRTVHHQVAHHLCSDCGIRLMFHDSEIMRAIMEELMARNIPGLPVHDSIRVPANKAVEVEAIMEEKKQMYFVAYHQALCA